MITRVVARTTTAMLVTLAVSACTAARSRSVNAPSGCCTAGALASGLSIAERYRTDGISARRFTHAQFWRAVSRSVSRPALRAEVIGRSMLGREIRSVSFGEGPVAVLLWSQMHGDESTATMAIADIFRFLAEGEKDGLRERLRKNLTVVFVPMLNPDGAELFQRENAAGIDINRDARRLVTPEARALKELRDKLQPRFGFNLHDQGARTRAGTSGPQAAIALLAPPFNDSRGYNDVRSRARLVAATIAQALGREIPGRIAKYDDSFNPRAFGDLMQQWGTSTVLIESGALPGDPQKQRLRALHVGAILIALDAIATGEYADADEAAYEALPYNTSGASDLLILGGQLVLPKQAPVAADVAINYDDPVARTGGRVRDVGDLQGSIAMDTVNAAGLFLHPQAVLLADGDRGMLLKIGGAAEIDLRRGASQASELVRRVRANGGGREP
ncbi:MAG: peptidase M14 [Anaerolineae bacterium]|nr:peptidase M14 [Gemmatimonadaceae bacterium]